MIQLRYIYVQLHVIMCYIASLTQKEKDRRSYGAGVSLYLQKLDYVSLPQHTVHAATREILETQHGGNTLYSVNNIVTVEILHLTHLDTHNLLRVPMYPKNLDMHSFSYQQFDYNEPSLRTYSQSRISIDAQY